MSLIYRQEMRIELPPLHREALVQHCHLALAAYHQGSSPECKAFGLVCGTVAGKEIRVAGCYPLQKNVRSQPPHKERMDKIMAEHAIPSKTQLEMRGWVADPAELFERIRECRGKGQMLLGTYHMHWVGWEHDPLRDTPTNLDTILGQDSGLLMFIVSMVDPARPIIRAYYEGVPDQEISIR